MGIFGFIKSIFNREDNDIEKNKNIDLDAGKQE